MTFQHLLHDLIALTGRRVSITASTTDGGYPVLAASGVLRGGVEVLGVEPDSEDEVIYLPLNIYADTGLMLPRSQFEGAEWLGNVLRIRLGDVVVEIDPQ